MQSSFITNPGQRPSKSYVDIAIESSKAINVGTSDLPLRLRICILEKFY